MGKGKMKLVNMEAIMEEHTTLSLRKVAAATEVNYNMLLKAARKPIDGQIYDPSEINWGEVNAYIESKSPVNVNEINWVEVASKDVQVRIAEIADFVVGSEVKLRNDETIYKVVFVSSQSAQIVIYNEDTNVTRLFKAATFLHQGPKLLAVVEEDPENLDLVETLSN